MTVDYETHDGTAMSPADYTTTRGTLSFSVSQQSAVGSVPIIDDSHDDDGEIFRLVLSNATGARIADSEAVGTIRNSDAMPRAWIGRFCRTVAGQLVDAVEGRLRASRLAGASLRLAGQTPVAGSAPDKASAVLLSSGSVSNMDILPSC